MPERRPHPNGVLDPRLGISNKRSICETCGQGLADCTGHFGHIHLELPVFHIGYFKNTVQILQAICKTCSRVLVSDEERRRTLRWVPHQAACMQACMQAWYVLLMRMRGGRSAAVVRLAVCRCIRLAGGGDGAAVGCGGLSWKGGAYAGACCPSSLAVPGAMPKRVEAETLPAF
jgi:DNA-directed RNA polymerase beta' subunit